MTRLNNLKISEVPSESEVPAVRAPGRHLKTSDFLRQLKAAQASGKLPFVASTIAALGYATAMAL
jgi:hypothetical protein